MFLRKRWGSPVAFEQTSHLTKLLQVIKALYDYEPESKNSQELSFHKGDFFHVLSREDDPDWYEACNPLIPSARGLVPVAFFEEIKKTQRQSTDSAKSVGNKQENHDSGFSERGAAGGMASRIDNNRSNPGAHGRMKSLGKGPAAMVYGIVQYDFKAERPDELQASAGEAIIVIAQSNPEWFVAKPIGRLGGPGLIPVSFVQLKDMSTGELVADPLDAVKRAGVPKVEEWKKMAADYKNSSISLGRLESSQQQLAADVGRMSLNKAGPPQPAPPQPTPGNNGYVRTIARGKVASGANTSSRATKLVNTLPPKGPPKGQFRSKILHIDHQSSYNNSLDYLPLYLPRYLATVSIMTCTGIL